jgi:NADH-quinone oxidoreductase subunit C/D
MQTAEDLVYSQVEENLYRQFGQDLFVAQYNVDKIPTLWVGRDRLVEVLQFLKPSFSMLYDLFAIDERTREHRKGQPDSDFTLVYQLLSIERNEDLRIKVALSESDLNVPSIISIWPNANWYEREAWDMFGVLFAGHPNLFRILLPPTWEGHALRKDHPARATEMGEFEMGPQRVAREQEALRFRP